MRKAGKHERLRRKGTEKEQKRKNLTQGRRKAIGAIGAEKKHTTRGGKISFW